jgi:putative colanic acid biosynthesis UDP-glucose lipid carrier transferase
MKGKYYSRAIKAMIFLIDFWLIDRAFATARYLGFAQGISPEQFTSFFLTFSLIWIIAGFFFKIYRIDTFSLMRSVTINLASAFAVHLAMIAVIIQVFKLYPLSLQFIGIVYGFAILFITGLRVSYKLVLKYFEFTGFDQRNVIIIGATPSGRSLFTFFAENQSAGYRFRGFFDNQKEKAQDCKSLVVGKLEEIKTYCVKEKIDEIYFALPPSYQSLLLELQQWADDNFIYFRIVPDFSPAMHENYNAYLINSIPILTARKEPLGITINAYLKRAFDIGFSLAVITLVFPVILPVIGLAITLDSPGPIFFKQLRPGKRNKLFECYKFRTMRVNNNTELQATKGDSRITRIGAFLRKTSLDELPQFFNVLLGNMSVVGPRPNLTSQLEEYSQKISSYRVRHFVNPGITGYAQVNGYRGETRELRLMEKRVEYDVLYMENWSLSLDIKIIFLTVWNMFKGEKNAY